MDQYEIKVTGRVQGVGFRYFTKQKANEHNIKGWVKNTSDGGVLIVAAGAPNDIETFIDYLKIGPPLSRVDNISKIKIVNRKDFHSFNVKF